MKNPSKTGKHKLSAFWQFLLMYIIILSIAFAALVPIHSMMLDISKESYLNEAFLNLERCGQIFSNTINYLYQVPRSLQCSRYYNYLLVYDEDVLTVDHYVYLSEIRDLFCELYVPLQMPDESFIFFSNCGAGATKSRVYPSMGKCFDEYIRYEDLSSDDIMSLMDETGQFAIIPGGRVIVNDKDPQTCVTILTRHINSSVVVGSLLGEDTLLDFFNISNLPKDTFFYIVDDDEELIYSYQYDGLPVNISDKFTQIKYHDNEYTALNVTADTLGMTAVVGIPDEYFSNMMSPLRELSLRYIITALTIGIVLCIGFAIFNYKPLRMLLRMSDSGEYPKKNCNISEYDHIRNFMAHTRSVNQKLQQRIKDTENTLRTNLMIRLMYGNLTVKETRSDITRLIPELAASCRLAIMNTGFFDEEISMTDYLGFFIFEQITGILGTGYTIAQLDRTTFAVLIPDNEKDITIFKEAIRVIEENIKINKLTATVGVSRSFMGVDNIHIAVREAQYCLMTVSENPVIFYDSAHEDESTDSLGWIDHKRLYQLIVSGKTEAANDLLDGIVYNLIHSGTNAVSNIRMTYYLIQYILYSAITDLRLGTADNPMPEYKEGKPLVKSFEQLTNIITDVGKQITERNNNVNAQMKQALFEYIDYNFSDKDIFAQNIAEKFGITERYVYMIVRECTGKSLCHYIESLRIKKATDLLLSTDLSVDEIADVCGFNARNTFYRAFKNHCGVSPGQFRRNSAE